MRELRFKLPSEIFEHVIDADATTRDAAFRCRRCGADFVPVGGLPDELPETARFPECKPPGRKD